MPHPTTMQNPPGTSGHGLSSQCSGVTPMRDVERLASFVGGIALAYYGLRRSLGHLALIAGGSALIYHAIKGSRPRLRGAAEPDEPSGDRQRH